MKSEFFNPNSKPGYALMSTISGHVLFLPSYKTWKDQISDIDAGCVNKTYHDLGICDEMDVPLWSECRQRNVIRQRILICHKK